MQNTTKTPEQRRNRQRAGGAGLGGAAATVGVAIAANQGLHIDPATATAIGTLFTGLFGWVGGLFGRE